MPTVAIDAMGGDFAPDQTVAGVARVSLESDIPCVLIGDEPRILNYAGQDPLGLLLDVGATIRCESTELVQFAIMGFAYAKRISKVARPRVGLLNMGSEPMKGGPVLREAFQLLSAMPELEFV